MSAQRYLVSARKYRPKIFDDLVAQDHVAETLNNALRSDRLAHAYLFSGPRGVGKTTAARILAKAINCTAPAGERKDGVEPCLKCDSCRAFEEGRNLSIFEIDAASNNKVEDMRELRESVRIPPQGSRWKVYIIDEVHMLTNQAFNALLKTLEEPPPHVLFIFATTEPHKVLPTIQSRCQRFDFKRIPMQEIVQQLEVICREENITADEESLILIARRGDGAMRDALSVFDQAVALCGTDLSYRELTLALGVVEVDMYFEVTDAVTAHDSAAMLRLVDRVVSAGHDLQEFTAGLAEHVRNLLVARSTGEASLIEAAEALRERFARDADNFEEADLLRMLTIVSDAESELRTSTHPRLRVELALLKMAALTSTVDIRKILARLDEIPAGDQSGRPIPKKPEARPTPRDDRGQDDGGQTVQTPPPAPPPTPQSAPRRTPPQPRQTDTNVDDIRSRVFNTPALKLPKRGDQGEASAGGRPEGDGADVGVEDVPSPVLDDVTSSWPNVVAAFADQPRLSALIQHARPVHFSGGELQIDVPTDFYRQSLVSAEQMLQSVLTNVTGASITSLSFQVNPEMQADDDAETAGTVDPYEYLQRRRADNEVLQILFEEFGSDISH